MYSLPFYCYCVCESHSHVWLFATPWGVTRQSLVHGILQARILGPVAISFSRGSSWARDQTWVLCIAGGLFTIWATRERVRLQRGRCGRGGFSAWFGKILWRRKWLPAPVFLPGESHGQRNLEGYSPWRHKERDTTEGLTLYCYYTTRTELITFRNYFVFFLLPLIYKILGGKHSCVFGFFFPLLWSIFLTARKMCGT